MITTIHKNLHNGLWSITQKGVVVGYCSGAILTNCDIKEDAKKAAFSRSGNKRTVHLWVRGDLCLLVGFVSFKGRDVVYSHSVPWFDQLQIATYNPKRGDDGFQVNGETWTGGAVALFDRLGMSVG